MHSTQLAITTHIAQQLMLNPQCTKGTDRIVCAFIYIFNVDVLYFILSNLFRCLSPKPSGNRVESKLRTAVLVYDSLAVLRHRAA
jgi:hypothetical protein